MKKKSEWKKKLSSGFCIFNCLLCQFSLLNAQLFFFSLFSMNQYALNMCTIDSLVCTNLFDFVIWFCKSKVILVGFGPFFTAVIGWLQFSLFFIWIASSFLFFKLLPLFMRFYTSSTFSIVFFCQQFFPIVYVIPNKFY